MRQIMISLAAAASLAGPVLAQDFVEPKHDIAWNRYYDVEQVHDHMRRLARAYPQLIDLEVIGKSGQGRDLLMATITAPGDDDRSKPAMWIDGGIHANEIQGVEVALYGLWYLATHYGQTDDITELLDDYTFYILPIVNPDSRAVWFSEPSTSSNHRANQMPIDSDRDGQIDEDSWEDLDGDGSITQMWKHVPGDGDWDRDEDDPRIFTRTEAGKRGDWRYLGREGVDNDGDGRVNEDSTDGHDMNRNWPGDWQPDYVQRGAGAYPFSAPETRAIGEFCYDHPNLAAFQSFHNTGGMILRGPGTDYRQGVYPRADLRVYDRIGEVGELLLPYYNYWVIFDDLYNVHGGEATWAAEALGIISFTNELWTGGKYFQRDVRPTQENLWLFRDRLQFGQVFTDFTEVEHPQYGDILVGGLNKWSSRSTPTFMLEEECHRNFGFTSLHADSMPKVTFDRVAVEKMAGNLWSVKVELTNEKIIPTRTARAQQAGIGTNDILELDAGRGSVVASGSMRNWFDTQMSETRHEPGRVQLPGGVPGEGSVIHRFLIEAPEGTRLTLKYTAEKAMNQEMTVELRD
ncbi:MAG: M14 family metallopeptidase [Planctomycetota bacterium]